MLAQFERNARQPASNNSRSASSTIRSRVSRRQEGRSNRRGLTPFCTATRPAFSAALSSDHCRQRAVVLSNEIIPEPADNEHFARKGLGRIQKMFVKPAIEIIRLAEIEDVVPGEEVAGGHGRLGCDDVARARHRERSDREPAGVVGKSGAHR